MPTPSKGTIGSLDYPPEERKKLAKKSLTYDCPDCGVVADFLKSQNNSEDSITSTAEEAKEIIKTMSLKVYSAFHLEVPFLPPEMADLCNINVNQKLVNLSLNQYQRFQ